MQDPRHLLKKHCIKKGEKSAKSNYNYKNAI